MDTWDPTHHYRRGTVVTAMEAAFFQHHRAKQQCAEILVYLRTVWPDGKTDDEGRDETRKNSYRRRRSDLLNAGLVEATPMKRLSKMGRPMIVWRAVSEPVPTGPQQASFLEERA